MKFIHFADAHLDSPFRGLSFLPSKAFNQIYHASEASLKRIVDLAITEKVDLVLIAGDTFDSSHPSPHSQLFFAEQIKRLTDAEIQVVMIFGNHDHMKLDDLLVTSSPFFKLLGPNEEVETVNYQTKTGFKYSVVGFSYLNNHITEDKLIDFPNKNNNFTFGIMHAQEQTTTVSQNVYAPFSLNELRELNYDYFALGHIHLRQVISEQPWIVYPGNIQGRHIKELGEKGCYLGEINENDRTVKLSFHATSPIVWQTRKIELTHHLNKNELRSALLELGEINATTYFSLRVEGAQYLDDEEIELVQDSDFWESLSIDLPYQSQIVDLRFEEKKLTLTLNDNDRQAFAQAKEEIFSEQTFRQLISDWSKKDILTQKLAEDPQFKREVETLAKVKLSRKLKGISDETETD